MFRLLALLGGLSVVTDLGTGAPTEESLKRCLVATRFARSLGLPDDEVRSIVYTALLQHLGCTAFSSEAAQIFGDDISTTRLAFLTNWADPSGVLRTWVPGVARTTGRSRARVLGTTITRGRVADANGPPATCEVARDAARRLGLPESVRESLHSSMAMWNGKGHPPLTGTGIPLCTRVMQVASTAVLFALHADPRAAAEELRTRSGSYLDPDLVTRFDVALLDDIEDVDAFAAVLELEPDPVELVDPARVTAVARTFGDLVDLKSTSLHGHATAVGDLAYDAARILHLPEADDVRVAGYLHDLGRVAVSSRIWDKPSGLTTSERDQVELHPHHTERILSRVPALREVAVIAGAHHERSDGSGYHRGVTGASLSMGARVLAAADRYRNLIEPRAYRPAAPAAEASSRLNDDVRHGRLDGDAVAAVLQAAGHRTGYRRPRPAGLTERQVEVIRLLAGGLSNKQIGRALGISGRTAERHVQDVYEKIGLSTRAGAALYAMEHGLVEKSG